MGVFYIDDGLIGSWDMEWIKGSLRIIIGLLRCIGLMANSAKFKIMTCQPGMMRTGMSEEAMGRRSTGKIATYQESLRKRLLCPDFGVDLMEGSMINHRRRLHGKEMAINRDRLLVSHTDHLTHFFEVIFLRVMTNFQCPSTECSGSSCTRRGLRKNFNRQYWRDSMMILQEHPSLFLHCDCCGFQVPPWILNNRHYTT